jgi:hypothetical protein
MISNKRSEGSTLRRRQLRRDGSDFTVAMTELCQVAQPIQGNEASPALPDKKSRYVRTSPRNSAFALGRQSSSPA